MNRIFLDLETTGTDPAGGDRVIEVGAVAYDGAGKVEGGRFHEYVNPERDIPEAATEIHGLTYAKLADKPVFADIAGRLLDFIKGHEILAHNASFDVSFLDMEFARLGLGATKDAVNKVTDTLEMARRIYPGRSNSLDALAARAGIDVGERRPVHSAIVDAEILAEVHQMMTGGQTELTLLDAHMDLATDVPQLSDISVVPIPASAKAAAAHSAYLEWMESRGARPMIADHEHV